MALEANTLESKVSIHRRFLRSVHLEKDLDQISILQDYIITSTGLEILSRIANGLSQYPSNRAWSLTGPYGAGKSAFGVFLGALLGAVGSQATRLAVRKLESVDSSLTKEFLGLMNTGATRRFLRVVISGAPKPLPWSLLVGLERGAREFWNKPGRNPEFLNELSEYLVRHEPAAISSADVMVFLEKAVEAAAKGGASGVVIFVDELGKILEFTIERGSKGDVFLLQSIAESFARSSEIPCGLVCFLHQSFEAYAAKGSEDVRDEWAKVHGRFEDVAFLESDDQILALIASALNFSSEIQGTELSRWAEKHTNRLLKLDLLPWERKRVQELVGSCYPLHPLTALALPIISRKYGQNERSVFTFLASQGPRSFREFLRTIVFRKTQPPSFGLWDLYDYFGESYHSLLASHADARRWAQLRFALERLGDAPQSKADLLKTIGFLNILGIRQNLRASEKILCYAFQDTDVKPGEIQRHLKSLREQSLVTYRAYADEYRVWEGSDFDIEGYLRENQHTLGAQDVVEVLNHELPPSSLVARRHSAEKGLIRYFSIRYATPEGLESRLHLDDQEDGRIIVIVATSQDVFDYVTVQVRDILDPRILFTVLRPTSSALHTAANLQLLREAPKHHRELQNDPIIRREMKDRIAAMQNILSEELEALFDFTPESASWFWKGLPVSFTGRDAFTAFLSEVCDEVFPSTPKIWNELINRRNLSSTSAAARTKLIGEMVNRGASEALGITGYPAERSIYESLLRSTGLHRYNREEDVWEFTEPAAKSDPGLRTVWKRLKEIARTSEKNPVSIDVIYALLKSPPFGMKEGPIPVIVTAFLLANESEIALYERGTFVPVLTKDVMERLVKNPGNFSLQLYRLAGLRSVVLQKYLRMITGTDRKNVQVLDVIRPLYRFIKQLPKYSLVTKHLSEESSRLRRVLLESKSPVKLLFEDLPAALKYQPFRPQKGDASIADSFLVSLTRSLNELQSTYDALLHRVVHLLVSAFNLSPKEEDARAELRSRASALLNYTVDPKLRSFLIRASDSELEFVPWVESIATLLSQKPPHTWHDTDAASFEINLSVIARRFINVEGLRLSTERYQFTHGGASRIFRINLATQTGNVIRETEEIVFASPRPEPGFDRLINEYDDRLKALDRRMKLLLLASLMDRVMDGGKQAEKETKIK